MRFAWYAINERWVRASRRRPLNLDRMSTTSSTVDKLHPLPLHPPPPRLAEFDWESARTPLSAGCLCSPPLSLQVRLFHCPSRWLTLKMPRRRGISRRGGSSASRGRASHSTPQNVIPITSASPSSPPSIQARHLPNNSFQSSRFTFHSRLNRPVLTASITIILAEEEDHPSDPAISSSSQTQEDSTHQGGMEGAMFTADNMQEDSLVLEASMQQKDSNQLDVLECEPVHQDYDVLHLVTPTEGGTDGIWKWRARNLDSLVQQTGKEWYRLSDIGCVRRPPPRRMVPLSPSFKFPVSLVLCLSLFVTLFSSLISSFCSVLRLVIFCQFCSAFYVLG